MERPNWDNFNINNRDKTKAFEDMCRVLFLRRINKNSYDYDYNFNQAGLEIEPIYDRATQKWYGAQCKYFSTESNSVKYAQIYKSLKKALKYYVGKLNIIYIYTNAELQHVCSEEDIASSQSSDRLNIVRDARKNNIELVWMQADNITDTLIETNNVDLLKLYFSETREIDFCNSILSINERTFLHSNEFMDLKLTDEILVTQLSTKIIDNKINLLAGSAGTGKTIALKKLYLELSNTFTERYNCLATTETTVYIPIYIRLRECNGGNLENLVRDRFKDYNLNFTDASYNYVFLLDGLDEVPSFELDRVIHYIENVMILPHVISIVVSARSDSNNLLHFRQKITCKEFVFEKLTENDIGYFFEHKSDAKKSELLNRLQNKKLLNDIDDIFSINLLWNNIERIDNTTSKIEIIELSINYWISKYSKYHHTPILEPKQKKIIDVCKEAAFKMQTQMTLIISLTGLQKIIMDICGVSNPNDVNSIVDSLTELFFESNNNNFLEISLSFKHRRYQEYFLYLKVNQEFFNNPNILRELRLLPNKDFVINIFLRTSLKNAELSSDIFQCLALRLFECYLGMDYLNEYKDELIGKNRLMETVEPPYSYSKSFLYLLSTYTPENLGILFEDKNLSINDAINENNFPEFIEIYYRENKQYIGELVKEKCSISNIKVDIKTIYSYYYFLCNINDTPIDDIYEKEIANIEVNENEIIQIDYVNTINDRLSAFIKLCLEFNLEFLTSILENANNCFLEFVCFELLKYRNINIFLGKSEINSKFIEVFIKRIESKNEKYFINTMLIYNFISKKSFKRDELKNHFDKINIRHYNTWYTGIESHIALAILLEQKKYCQVSEYKLGIEIIQAVIDNKAQLDDILTEWINIIKPYNFIYDDWFMYANSRILGDLISFINFDENNLKLFLRKLAEYYSVISMQSVLFTIFKNNKTKFKSLINKEFLDRVLKDAANRDPEEYDGFSETIFQFAAMYSVIDIDKSYYLLMHGIENSILRPSYRSEELASIIMPKCLYVAYQDYWYNNYEFEHKCTNLYHILEFINKTTDGAGGMGVLKWLINHCLSDEFLKYELYDISEYSILESPPTNSYDMKLINIDNLEKYYNCEIEDAPYASIDFWKSLIDFEYSIDTELKILYSVFEKNYYPSMHGFNMSQYLHLPTAVLFKQENTKTKIFQYVLNKGGKYGLCNMIAVYSILGEAENGIKGIEFLFQFLNTLIAKEPIGYGDFDELTPAQKYMNICQTDIDDWISDENNNTMKLKTDFNIKIVWTDFDDKEKFREEWATKFPDKSAYRYDYVLYDGNNILNEFSLVKVDGYRATLPIPKINTNLVNRDEYLLSRLFNSNPKEHHSYMIRAGLQVK